MNTSPDMPSSRPMTLRQQLLDLCEKHHISEGLNTCDKTFEDDLVDLCQEIAREAASGASEKPKPDEDAISKQVANLLEIAKYTTNSSDFYVHIIWLIEGLEVWHRSGGKRGHSPDNTKRYVVSSILNYEAGNDVVATDPLTKSGLVKSAKDELTQKPPQPQGADSHTDIGDTVSGNEADNLEVA